MGAGTISSARPLNDVTMIMATLTTSLRGDLSAVRGGAGRLQLLLSGGRVARQYGHRDSVFAIHGHSRADDQKDLCRTRSGS